MVIQAFNLLDDEIRQKSISIRAEHYSEYNKKERKVFVVGQKFAFAVSCAISYNLIHRSSAVRPKYLLRRPTIVRSPLLYQL